MQWCILVSACYYKNCLCVNLTFPGFLSEICSFSKMCFNVVSVRHYLMWMTALCQSNFTIPKWRKSLIKLFTTDWTSLHQSEVVFYLDCGIFALLFYQYLFVFARGKTMLQHILWLCHYIQFFLLKPRNVMTKRTAFFGLEIVT